jgi:hypothetical protein
MPVIHRRKRGSNKYGNVKTTVDGFAFDSKKEAARYGELKLLQRAGEIRDLELQPRFPLVVNGHKVCTYVGDFKYTELAGVEVIEDVKGVKTDVYRLKAKLMLACLGIEITEI